MVSRQPSTVIDLTSDSEDDIPGSSQVISRVADDSDRDVTPTADALLNRIMKRALGNNASGSRNPIKKRSSLLEALDTHYSYASASGIGSSPEHPATGSAPSKRKSRAIDIGDEDDEDSPSPPRKKRAPKISKVCI